jgi:hypothetical protein
MKNSMWFPFLRKGYTVAWYQSPILTGTAAMIGIVIYLGCTIILEEIPFLGVILGLVLAIAFNGFSHMAIETLAERFGVEVEDQ